MNGDGVVCFRKMDYDLRWWDVIMKVDGEWGWWDEIMKVDGEWE